MALTHDGCAGAYHFLAAPLQTVTVSIDTLEVKQELFDIVPTLMPTSLDHCCYHTAYPGPEGFGGLQVLATNPSTGMRVLVCAGVSVSLSYTLI